MTRTIRNGKDTVFRMIFQDRKELLSLYNALNGTCYTNEKDLAFKTLENAVYMNVKNDVSFVFANDLSLYEHQSTKNPNMPLRDLFYVAHNLQEIVDMETVYSSRLIRIPNPRFVVFYNGRARQPERMELRLSDAFLKPTKDPELELKVTVLNINSGNNRQLMEQCRTLREYMQYVEMVREYSRELPAEEAVKKAVDDCIRKGILEEFFRKNKAEAVAMSIFEYDEEKHMALIRSEGYEDGVAYGKSLGIEEGIEKGRLEGIQQGITQGIEQGIKKGITQGIEQGIGRGKEEKAIEVYRTCIARGMTQEDAAAIAGISSEAISKI